MTALIFSSESQSEAAALISDRIRRRWLILLIPVVHSMPMASMNDLAQWLGALGFQSKVYLLSVATIVL